MLGTGKMLSATNEWNDLGNLKCENFRQYWVASLAFNSQVATVLTFEIM
jgi:hypothetical protein